MGNACVLVLGLPSLFTGLWMTFMVLTDGKIYLHRFPTFSHEGIPPSLAIGLSIMCILFFFFTLYLRKLWD